MNYAKEWNAEHERRLMYAPPLRAVREFFEIFDDPSEMMVLEVGCGAGSNAIWLADQGFDVHAFDSSPHAIARLRGMMHGRMTTWVADAAHSFPVFDNAYDVVFEVRALENLSTTEALLAMQEMVRVLKPGGVFYSLTASIERDDALTTCGIVRKTSEKQAAAYLDLLDLSLIEMRRMYEGAQDLEICATKEIPDELQTDD